MKMYKLVSQEYTTYGGMFWEIGKKNSIAASLRNKLMCSPGVLHCYRTPLMAVFLNPIHADIANPRLLEIEVDMVVADDGLKCASWKQTPIKEINLPHLTTTQKVAAAILVVKPLCTSTEWTNWANKWLSGEDRSVATAYAAYAATAYASAASAAYAAYVATAAATAYAATASAFRRGVVKDILERVVKEF